MSKTVKFNAGKVQYDEETKRCTPLPHKGTIVIKQNVDDEEFYDFVWAPKTNSGNIEKDELLIIPGDVSFKQVKSSKTGRVFALTFLSSGAKHLYWLQDVGDDDELDKLTDKDHQILNKITEIISPVEEPEDPPAAASAPAPSTAASASYPHLLDLDDVFPFEVLAEHIRSLLQEEFEAIFNKEELPPSIAENLTKESAIDLIRSGFFQQSKSGLSSHLKKASGAGYLLSQTFGLDYEGEGIANFLKSIRRKNS